MKPRKIYIVQTKTSLSGSYLNTINTEEYSTTDKRAAYKVFDDEIEYLSKYKVRGADLDYNPTDREMNHAWFVELFALDYSFEEDDPDFLQWIATSDYFFDE